MPSCIASSTQGPSWWTDNVLRQPVYYLQVQVAVDTASGVIQMKEARQHQQSLAFSASLHKATPAAPVSTTSSLKQPSQLASMLMHALPPASQKSAVAFGTVHLSATVAQQEQAGAMSMEGSLQLANVSKLSCGSLAAASAGMAATWEALQMCPPNAADSLQFMTVGVSNDSIHSDHMLHTAHWCAAIRGLGTKPVSMQPVAAPSLPLATPQTAQLPVGSAANGSMDSRAEAAQQAVTNADQLQADQPAVHRKLLAMDVHERKMFIQAQVCCLRTACTTLDAKCCLHCVVLASTGKLIVSVKRQGSN